MYNNNTKIIFYRDDDFTSIFCCYRQNTLFFSITLLISAKIAFLIS